MHLGALFIASRVLALGSIRKTARELSLSVSTVSGALRQLETALALKLAERAAGELATLIASAKVEKGLQPILAAMRVLADQIAEPPAPAAYDQWAARLSLKMTTIERFIEVADQGSINRAARKLRLGQPQLSLQIANLEEMFGCRLLERQAQGSVLTRSGEQLYAVLSSIRIAWNAMKGAADERFQRAARTVHIGSIIPTGSESWVARTLGTLVARWGASGNRNTLSLVSMTADDLREALRSGQIDVAILDSAFGLEAFEHEALIATDMVAIAPLDARETTLADLVANHPLCLPSARTGIGDAALALSYSRNPSRRDITAADSLPVIVDLVSRHGYVSFLGRVSAEPIADRVRIVELDRLLPISYYLAHGSRKAALEAARMIREAVTDTGASEGERRNKQALSDVTIP